MVDEKLADRVRELVAGHDRRKHGMLSFTVEMGRGETYRSDALTLYAHDSYPRSSVLYGRERRMWLGEFGTGETGQQNASDTVKAAGIARITTFLGGSSHVPIDQIVSHLPDDTDY